jgi:hypothetical protein
MNKETQMTGQVNVPQRWSGLHVAVVGAGIGGLAAAQQRRDTQLNAANASFYDWAYSNDVEQAANAEELASWGIGTARSMRIP